MAQFSIKITKDGIIPIDDVSKRIVQGIMRDGDLPVGQLPSDNWRYYTDDAFEKRPRDSRDEDEEDQGQGKQKQYNVYADSAVWADGESSNDHPALKQNGSDTSQLSWTNIFRFLLAEFCSELREPENNGHVSDAYGDGHYFMVFDSKERYDTWLKKDRSEHSGFGFDKYVVARDPETGRQYWVTAYQYAGWATIATAVILLKRFGRPGQSLALTFTIKDSVHDTDESDEGDAANQEDMMSAYPGVYGYEDYRRLIEEAGTTNLIFHGAPGTGKTYTVLKAIAELLGHDVEGDHTPKDFFAQLSDDESERFGFVQFHPSYDYTDFVEGLRPSKRTGEDFELRAGTFMRFCAKARKDHDRSHHYYFLIDEINRGDVSNIFGELFFLLDGGYRGVGVSTQYENLHDDGFADEYLRSGESDHTEHPKFSIPENVTIIGTMNDIDRSVDSFDFAMRRRFRFIDYTWQSSRECFGIDPHSDTGKLMETMNDTIAQTEGLGEEYALGAAYFQDLDESAGDRARATVWDTKVGPLLREYLRGIPDSDARLQEFDDIWHGRQSLAVNPEDADGMRSLQDESDDATLPDSRD